MPKPPPTPHAELVQDWHRAWLVHRGGKKLYGFPAKDFVLMEEMLERAEGDQNLVRACIQLLLTSTAARATRHASVAYMCEHFDALVAKVLENTGRADYEIAAMTRPD